MVKLTRVIDAYFGDYAEYYTCERNIASMEIVQKRTRFSNRQLTQITTFDGDKVCVSQTPEEIFELLEKDK